MNMTKELFLFELTQQLNNLPKEERDRTREYYSEMIADRIEEGMDEAEKIVSQRTDRMDRPLEPQRIQSIRVETNGVEYPFTKL